MADWLPPHTRTAHRSSSSPGSGHSYYTPKFLLRRSLVPIESRATYQIRDFIRNLGGKWDPEKRCWLVPPLRKLEVLEKLATLEAPQ